MVTQFILLHPLPLPVHHSAVERHFTKQMEKVKFHLGKTIRLGEAQVGIKIARKNIYNLRYANDTTLRVESEEELKNPLMKGKEESEKVGLKLNIQKTKIMAPGPITSWQIDGEAMETVTGYVFGLQNHCRWRLQP